MKGNKKHGQLFPSILCLQVIIFFGLLPLNTTAQSGQDTVLTTINDTVKVDEPEPDKYRHPFDHITAPPPVEIKTIPDSQIKEMKNDPAFWYASGNAVKRKKADEQGNGSKIPWNTVFWIFILAASVLIAFLLVTSIRGGVFRKKAYQFSDQQSLAEHQHLMDTDFESMIQAALKAGNYNEAVRWYYLFILKLLNERSLISFDEKKTASTYVNELRKNTLHTDFSKITRSFEIAWYSKVVISQEAFLPLQAQFQNFIHKISG